MSTLSVTTLKSKTALTPPVIEDINGVGVGTFCRAWVNFNGSGTVAIRASFNVTSITDNGTGDYTVNFTNAMPDANYAVAGVCNPVSNTGNGLIIKNFDFAYTTSAARIRSINPGVGFYDSSEVSIAVFR